MNGRALAAGCAAGGAVLVAQRAASLDATAGWTGPALAFALGALLPPAGTPGPRALWLSALGLLALGALPWGLPPGLASAAPILACASVGAWARGPLGEDGALRPGLAGVAVACAGAAALRWGLAAADVVVLDTRPWAALGLLLLAPLGWIAAAPAPAGPRSTPGAAEALAALACARVAATAAATGGLLVLLDAPRPWAWGALLAGSALLGLNGARRLKTCVALEAGGWVASAALLLWGSPPLGLALLLLAGATGLGAAAAGPGLARSRAPALGLIAGLLLGPALGQGAFARLDPPLQVRLALAARPGSELEQGVRSGLVRLRDARGGYAGAQVIDLGGDRPLRLLVREGRVREALPQRKDGLPELLRAPACAAALAAWLAPGPRLLLADVGTGYTAALLSEAEVELEGCEPSAAVAATWTEPGDPWGLWNGRLGEAAERRARLRVAPLLPRLRAGADAVLLPASPAPSVVGLALRQPLAVGPLDLRSGLAEARVWAEAEHVLVFRVPESEVRVALAGVPTLSWARLQAGWARDRVLREELVRLGVASPAHLVACLEGDREALQLALKSPEPAETLGRAARPRLPGLLVDADAAARVEVTRALAEAASPEALRWAEAAVQAERSAEALATLGSLLLAGGDVARGAELLRDALEVDPTLEAPRLRLAYELQRAGRVDDAEALLREGLRPEATQPALHFALAQLAEAREDPRAALAEYEAAGDAPGAAERAAELRATLSREHVLATRVRAAFELLRAAEAGDAEPSQGLQLCFELAEDPRLEQEDRVLLARTLAGFAALEDQPLLRGNLHRHRARVLEPLAGDPRFAERAAEAWLQGERPARALELLQPLCAGEGARDPQAQRLRGDALALVGEVAEARAAYRLALELGPALTTNDRTYEHLAQLEAQEGDVDAALELLARGDRALGGVARLRLARALLLERLERDAEARVAFEAYLDVAPPGPEREAVEARLGH